MITERSTDAGANGETNGIKEKTTIEDKVPY